MHILRQFGVSFVLGYIKLWAKLALLIHRPTIIGIAGSVGKSSTKDALYAILKDVQPTDFTYGNSETGVPLGILGINAGSSSAMNWIKNLLLCPFKIFHLHGKQYLIVEMGTDEPDPPKNMEYLLGIIKPDLAIWLNAYPIHTQQFEQVLHQVEPSHLKLWDSAQRHDYVMRALAHEDGKIITQSGARMSIYGRDNHYVNQEITSYLSTNALASLQSFGQDPTNTISYGAYQVDLNQTTFNFQIHQQTITINLPKVLLPQEYREVFAPAIQAASYLGLTPQQITAGLVKNFHLPKSRSTVLPGINDSVILDSSYNAATTPTIAQLNLMADLKQQTNRPVVFVWGDMRELGTAAQAEHEQVASHLAGIVDYLYCVGPLTQQFVWPFIEHQQIAFKDRQWFQKSNQAGAYLKDHLPANALVLVKGSQNTIFLEEAIKSILVNPADAQQLCRQESHWLKRKQQFFIKP